MIALAAALAIHALVRPGWDLVLAGLRVVREENVYLDVPKMVEAVPS